MRAPHAAVLCLALPVLGGCPDTAGCRSDDDCPAAWHCDVAMERCAPGDPAVVTTSSSNRVVASSSSGPAGTSGSSSAGPSSMPVLSSSLGPSSLAPSSSAATSSSSSVMSNSEGLRVTGGFHVGGGAAGTAGLRVEGGFVVAPHQRSGNASGLVIEGRFE